MSILPSGKAKYEQLVEVRLALEMEINTYRSILEDEEKRIRKWAEKEWEDHGDDDANDDNDDDEEEDDHKDDNADGDVNDDDALVFQAGTAENVSLS